MGKKKKKTTTTTTTTSPHSNSPEWLGMTLLVFAALFTISLTSYFMHHTSENALGFIGFTLARVSENAFGAASFLLPIALTYAGVTLIRNQQPIKPLRLVSFLSVALCCTALLLTVAQDLFKTLHSHPPLGGKPFLYLYQDLPHANLKHLINANGVLLLSTLGICAALVYILHIDLKKIAQQFMEFIQHLLTKKYTPEPLPEELSYSRYTNRKIPPPTTTLSPTPSLLNPLKKLSEKIPKPQTKTATSLKVSSKRLPPLSLLTPPKHHDIHHLQKDLKKQADTLEKTLESFGIEAKVEGIQCGPVITSFEVQPAYGVKVQKIKALENDLALNLKAKSIRIIAPIPGKAFVGIEIPNPEPQEVGFKDLLAHYQACGKRFHLPILLGKAVNGDYVMSDLAKMPHCIIAGATGSGKSVCINTIVMALLHTRGPEELKLLMIDPKKVELTPYSKLPHMIAPVITEPHGAANALLWLVREMETRYELLKQLGVRNIEAFNQRKKNLEFESSLSIDVPPFLPYMVAIIDEFADLMMVAAGDIETPIARIAQMARAVGIHLILATQRPSREVITGIIKANFPTRISFKVASRINSQIVLDDVGAESLLGNGDMLFLPPGSSQLVRAQGAYIRDEDISRVLSFLEQQGPPQYQIPSFDDMTFEAKPEDLSKDSLYIDAVKCVQKHQKASATFLQSKLKIGYARAASLIDLLEEEGVISSHDGNGKRKVLQTSQES